MVTTVLDKGQQWQQQGQWWQRQGWQATKRVRGARAARVKTIGTKVAGDEEGDSKSGKGNRNGNEVAGDEEGKHNL